MNKVNLTKYVINGPEGLSGKKLVFLSDFHEAQEGRLNNIIIKKIRAAMPDAVLIGGDMINGKNPKEDIRPAVNLINRIASEYKTYYAFGNHEEKVHRGHDNTGSLWKSYIKRLSDNVIFLDNKAATLCDGLKIYGINIPLRFYNRIKFPELSGNKISQLIGARDEDYTILLGHTPDFIKGYSDWGADLVLSGHFHGGMIRIPGLGGVISPRLKLFPKYDYGLYKEKTTSMIVTNGLGQHSIKIRINNTPEIVLISFK